MTSTTRAESPAVASGADAPAMTHRQVMESLSGILLGMFVSILATSVVSSSLPKIVSDLGGSQSSYTWVVTATLLTTTITTPIWGKLADLVNRKLLIQLALAISVISSAAAGFSQNVEFLIGMRAIQGIGAGGLTALATVLLADILSPRERGKYMGLMGGIMGIGMVGGPLLGGVITDAISWHWNFFVGLPFAIAAIIVLQRTLHLPRLPRKVVKIDYWGAALISAGIATLLLWVTFAGNSYDWLSWQTAVMVIGSLVILAVACVVETKVADPIIPMHLFKNRTLVLSVIASVAVGVAMFGTSVFLSQYMQVARGKTPTQSGLLTIPMILGLFISSTISGRLITKYGRYKGFMVAGAATLTVGLALMGTIRYDTSFVLVGLFMFVMGAGMGMLMQNLVLAVQNTLDVTEVGSGTSTVAFFRSLGGAIGVSALGAVLGSRITTLVTDGLTGIGIDPSALGGGTSAVPDVSTLPEPIKTVVESSYGEGIADLFLIAVPLGVIALIAVLFLKEVPLGRRSGVEQLLDQEQTSEAAVAEAGTPGAQQAVGQQADAELTEDDPARGTLSESTPRA
ncbi:MFS transporter [Cellulomonas hominis]|uniref:MFS transporter n=1 Tax=Cellulomonas hominis TaxID=156981 RepID=UPI001B8FD169|nr:MFS transporter [Cellulomonas hominis]VTR75333.1 Multidrug resistance protein 3 [Cellulomonas hominis]